MAETVKITLDTGVIDFDIADHKGNPMGVVCFNPTNTDIVVRINSMMDEINSQGFRQEREGESDAAYIQRLNDSLRSMLDVAVGSSVSAVFFSTVAPLALTNNNDYYFERVLEVISGILEKYTDMRVKKKMQKLEKARAKYNNR